MKANNKETNHFKVLAVIVTGFAVIYALTAWKCLLWISIIAGVFGIFSKRLLRIIVRIWDKISFVLSKIIPNLVLATVYYLILTPIALLSKFFSKSDHLMLKNNVESMFVDYYKEIKKTDFEKPW